MDFVIDVLALRDAENYFLPKEVSVVCLQGDVSAHWIIKSPYSFDELPDDIRTTNDYLASRMYGIHWFDGDVTLRKMQIYLQNIARKASRIYVKGIETARYIQTIMSHSVINIDNYANVSFVSLQTKFKKENMCLVHALLDEDYKKEFCTVLRANLIKVWFHSLLRTTPVSKNTSQAFYSELQRYVYKRPVKPLRPQFASSSREFDVLDNTYSTSECGSAETAVTVVRSDHRERKDNEHPGDKEGPGRVDVGKNDRGVCSGPDTPNLNEPCSHRLQHG